MSVAFPLRIGPNGRFKCDQNGVPFPTRGVAVWDAHITLSATDQATLLDALAAQGVNTLHTYLMNSVPYMTGGPQPANNAGQKPFTLNVNATAWTGVFANADAAFDSPNDSYFTTVAAFVDLAFTRNMVVEMHPMYAGAFHASVGDRDGWWQCLTNAHNTSSVCTGFGAYLANGHGTFTGFKTSVRPNLIWIMQGDSGIGDGTIGSTGSTRMQNIFTALKANGATQLVTQHITHDNLPNDMTDYSSFYDVYSAYTTPTTGEAYSEVRGVWGQTPIKPTKLLETGYWGERGLKREQVRYEIWGATLSCTQGAVTSFGPLWGFFSSPDGTTGGVTADCSPDCWVPSTNYTLNQYAHLGGNWYRCITAGVSAGSGGPTGTGTNITDGSVHWTFVATVSASLGGMANLLNEPGLSDHAILCTFFAGIPWWRLTASGLGGVGTIVTAGGGTQTVFVDGSVPNGTGDWVVAAVADDLSTLVAYVPDPHTGAFTVDCSLVGPKAWGYWLDPSNGAKTSIGAIPNSSQSFTVTGTNSDGAKDRVLLIQGQARALSKWIGE